MKMVVKARRLIAQENRGGSELQLWENCIDGRKEYEMVINGVFIMASYNSLSSELLIGDAMKKLNALHDVSILIGGLGMGFTVKAACSFPGVSKIDVVEIEPVVVEWNQRYFNCYNQNCLDDKRVNVVVGDFYDYVMGTNGLYNIISMDIDNGPMLLVNEGNRRVYVPDFFERIKEIMKPGGIFAIWSCNHDPNLPEQLRKLFADCDVEQVIEKHSNRLVPYYLYFAH